MEVWGKRINKNNKDSGSINYSNDPVPKYQKRKKRLIGHFGLFKVNLTTSKYGFIKSFSYNKKHGAAPKVRENDF